MEEQKLKKCPFCAEEIKEDAIKCKHCGSDLTGKEEKNKKEVIKVIQKPKEGLFLQTMNCGCLIFFIIIGITIFIAVKVINTPTKTSTKNTNTVSTETKTEDVVGKYAYNKTNGAYQGKIISIKTCQNNTSLKCYEVNPRSGYRNVEYPISMVEIKEVEGKLNE